MQSFGFVNTALRARYPSSPWMWRQGWVDRRLSYSHKLAGLAFLAFALVWNGMVWGIWLALRGTIPAPFNWMLIGFMVLGALLLWGGVRKAYISLGQRESCLLLRDVPQKPGTRFQASLDMGTIAEGTIRATLSCHHRPTTSLRSERVIWSESQEIPRAAVQQHSGRTLIPIDFAIPPDARGSERQGMAGEVRWILHVAVEKVPNVPEAECYFPIPVFADPEEEASTGEA